jgi:predicted nucleotidyltransferase
MTAISHNLIGKIDSDIIDILFSIDKVSRDIRIPFFIGGATARDILLQHAYDIHSTRATIDFDIGVFVSDWTQFQSLKDALIKADQSKPGKHTQRLIHTGNHPVDIIPFGKIAKNGEIISWPPKHELEMSIVGFQECYQ